MPPSDSVPPAPSPPPDWRGIGLICLPFAVLAVVPFMSGVLASAWDFLIPNTGSGFARRAAAFGAVKLAGYLLFAPLLRRYYAVGWARALGVVTARMALGFGAGIALWRLFYTRTDLSWGAPVFIVPLRCLFWWAVIRVGLDPARKSARRNLGMTLLGTLYSFLLDVPALGMFLLNFDIHVC